MNNKSPEVKQKVSGVMYSVLDVETGKFLIGKDGRQAFSDRSKAEKVKEKLSVGDSCEVVKVEQDV